MEPKNLFIGYSNNIAEINKAKSASNIGLLLSILFIAEALKHGVLGVGSIFLVHNSEGLFICLILANFLLMFVATLGVYLVFYILFPS